MVALFNKRSNEEIIRTFDLTKKYGNRKTVDQLNLIVPRGEIYGFLGPNGAGKTTTIRMILGLLAPTSGRVELMGKTVTRDTSDLHQHLGVVGEISLLYDDMTALEYLDFFARLNKVNKRKDRINSLLEQFELAPFHSLLVRDFSQGMQKKLSLARALLHDPQVLVLDEPVSGLDPRGIFQVRELLLEKRKAGKTIFISSHLLSEVERTADRVGIINNGKLVIEETVAAVSSRLSPGIELEIELQRAIPELPETLRKLSGIQGVVENGSVLIVQCYRGEDVRVKISQAITNAGGITISMTAKKTSLEEAFVRLTDEGEIMMRG